MKCIDAIEGTVKCILNRIHEVSLEDRRDDSEYVRSVKAVIDATDNFIEGNQEIIPDRDLLKSVLYRYSKELWRSTADEEANRAPLPGGKLTGIADASLDDRVAQEALSREPLSHEVSSSRAASEKASDENDGYRDYYFDYLYRHGVYPR
jgi:hypothetical protein